MDEQQPTETQPERSNIYGFDGQMLAFAAVTTVFLFVVLLVCLRLYARWCIRNGAGFGQTRVFVIADSHDPAAAGLDPGVLSSLPVFTYSSKSAAEAEQGLLECAVCLSEFEENEVGRLLPECKHSFHIECIDMWFHSHSTCPLCRSPVESSAAVERVELSPVGEEMSGPESSSGLSSSSRDEGVDESVMPLARRRRAASVKIDVVEGRIESELTEGSPMTRMQSFKRMLSMGGRSPAGSRLTPRYRAAEVDLEGGLGEAIRVYTPK